MQDSKFVRVGNSIKFTLYFQHLMQCPILSRYSTNIFSQLISSLMHFEYTNAMINTQKRYQYFFLLPYIQVFSSNILFYNQDLIKITSTLVIFPLRGGFLFLLCFVSLLHSFPPPSLILLALLAQKEVKFPQIYSSERHCDLSRT